MLHQMPLLHTGTQRKHKDSSSDVSSIAVLMRHQMQNSFDDYGCGCVWAIPYCVSECVLQTLGLGGLHVGPSQILERSKSCSVRFSSATLAFQDLRVSSPVLPFLGFCVLPKKPPKLPRIFFPFRMHRKPLEKPEQKTHFSKEIPCEKLPLGTKRLPI